MPPNPCPARSPSTSGAPRRATSHGYVQHVTCTGGLWERRVDAQARQREGGDQPLAIPLLVGLVVVAVPVQAPYGRPFGPAQHVLHRPDASSGRARRELDLRHVPVVHGGHVVHGPTDELGDGGGTLCDAGPFRPPV